MSGAREALFQAVLDNPADDAPRFAYAGYCDAQGDPYGAFIRAQLACTQELHHGSDEEAHRLREHARQLRYEHRTPEWTRGVEELGARPDFIRGFVGRVVMDARAYLDRADELYRRAPLQKLVLTEVGDFASALARDPHLAQITWLAIEGKPTIGDPGLAAIAASPYVRGLRVLEVPNQGISVAGIEVLCASKQLPALVYANLGGNQFEDPVEGYGTDGMTGRIVPDGAHLEPFGRQLEQQYGDLPWLHGPSRLRHFPPYEDEF